MTSRTVRFVFTRRRAIGSLLLRTVMWSAWSHCALIDDDHVIEAAFGHGVRRRPLDELLDEASEFEIVEIPVGSPTAVLAAARTQIGKPYDWRGVLGIAARRRWQDTDSWFCSEFIAWACARGGTPLVRVDAWRIRPDHLYVPIFRAA